MCTAINFKTRDSYFGRNLDLDRSYGERVTVTPRAYPFTFREAGVLSHHYAMIGMATVVDGYPLYYDAVNEHGLSIAALNFPGCAVFHPARQDRVNIATFELIPWLLGSCRDISEARSALERLNIRDIDYSADLPTTPLHFIVAHGDSSLTVESVAQGLRVYRNPVGILTNSPEFEYHLAALDALADMEPIPKTPQERSLPGDFSGVSRFVRAAFVKERSWCESDERSSVNHFFHLLGAVAHPMGSVRLSADSCRYTVYSSCINTERGIYYYTTYDDSTVRRVDMHGCDLDGAEVTTFPIHHDDWVVSQN